MHKHLVAVAVRLSLTLIGLRAPAEGEDVRTDADAAAVPPPTMSPPPELRVGRATPPLGPLPRSSVPLRRPPMGLFRASLAGSSLNL